jgi:type IV secretion system protein VirB1
MNTIVRIVQKSPVSPAFVLTERAMRDRQLMDILLFLVRSIPAICFFANATPGHADPLGVGAFMNLAQRCGSNVSPLTLAAVAKTESKFESLLLLDNTTQISRTYNALEPAASAAEHLIAKGHSVDVGLMQINSANLKQLGIKPRDALDPCTSIRAGASILTRDFLASRRAPTPQIALRDALSMYNTGNTTNGYTNGYVQKVESAAESLAAHFDPDSSVELAASVGPDRIAGSEEDSHLSDVWSGGENSLTAAGISRHSSDVNVF